MKKALEIIVLVLVLLLPTGCYDYTEPDEKAWVLALGLDKGRQNVLTVTAVVAVPKDIAGGEGQSGAGGGKGFFTVSVEAETMTGALELFNSIVDRRIDLSHNKWFVFSRELAEEGIDRHFAPVARFYQFRRTSQIMVCQGRAEEFLARGVPQLEANVGKYYELLYRTWRYTEFVPFDNFHHFYIKYINPGIEPVAMLAALSPAGSVYEENIPKDTGEYKAGAIPRKGGGNIETMGAAVFRKGKMVGTLNGNQVGVQKMFNGILRSTVEDIPDPEHPGMYVVFEMTPRQKPRVKVQIVNGYPRITADVRLEGDIISIQSGENYTTPERLPVLEKAVEKAVLENIEETVAVSRELEADFLGFGLHAKKLFSTWTEWEAYNWAEKYPLAEVEINVDFRVRRGGLIHEMMPSQ